jgi:hypothetical protein
LKRIIKKIFVGNIGFDRRVRISAGRVQAFGFQTTEAYSWFRLIKVNYNTNTNSSVEKAYDVVRKGLITISSGDVQ